MKPVAGDVQVNMDGDALLLVHAGSGISGLLQARTPSPPAETPLVHTDSECVEETG